jgi:hypothetical protein
VKRQAVTVGMSESEAARWLRSTRRWLTPLGSNDRGIPILREKLDALADVDFLIESMYRSSNVQTVAAVRALLDERGFPVPT